MATPMTLQRSVRSVAAFIAGVFVVFAVAWSSEAFAATTVSITSPAAGDTVAGDLRVEGTLGGRGEAELTVGLAPQTLGDCGPTAIEQNAAVAAGEPFSVSVDTSTLASGTYCAVVLVDGGRLSAAVGDVTIEPAFASDGGLQLPTLALPGDTPSTVVAAPVGAEVLIPTALGTVAAVSVVVLSVGLAIRRRRLQDA